MSAGADKALGRARKVVNFMRHSRPPEDAETNVIIRWAGAMNAARTIERYLEQCAMRDTEQCNTTA